MARKTATLLPDVTALLGTVGENIRLARLRRRLSVYLVSERAGMSLPTLRAVERGQSGVTIGAYASVLRVLGLEKDLSVLASADPLGRRLQDIQLTHGTKRASSSGSSRRAAKPARGQGRQ